MTELSNTRIPLTPAEHDAVEALLTEHGDKVLSLTRRDPGETGPVLVDLGDAIYEIDEAGKVTDG